MMIYLRHILYADKPKLIKYLTNPEVSKFLTWKPYTSDDDVEKYIQYAIQCTTCPDEILAIMLDNVFLGTVHIMVKADLGVQVGFGILPEFWNQGTGFKCAYKVVDYLKTARWLGCCIKGDGVSIVIHKENIYAKRIADGLGFKKTKRNVRQNFEQYWREI